MSGFGKFNLEVTGGTKPQLFILSMCKTNSSVMGAIKSLTGVNLDSFPFSKMFSGPSAVGVTIGSADMVTLPLPFSFFPLNMTSTLTRGLSLMAALRMPSSCSSDPFCNFFKVVLGNQQLVFRIYDIKSTQFILACRLPHTIKFAGLKFYNVEAGLVVSKTPSFGLTHIEMDLPTPQGNVLKFIGSLTVDLLQNADAKLWMKGLWQQAFYVPFLSIGNIMARAKTNIACPLCISALALGGEVWIGMSCAGSSTSNCIKGQGYFSIDKTDPDNNWVYASINQFSLSDILRAVSIKFPGMQITDFALCKNVAYSESRIDRVLPKGQVPVAVVVHAGSVFKGKVSLLWFVNVDFDMRILKTWNTVTYVKCSIFVGKIDLGLMKLTADNDESKGPLFFLEAGILPPKFGLSAPKFGFRGIADGKLVISALSVGVKVYATLDINGLVVGTTAKMFGFMAKFQVKATFIDKANPRRLNNFRIAGSFTTDLNLANLVLKILSGVQQKLRSSLNSAVSAAAQAEKKLRDALTNKAVWESYYNAKKSAFDAADKVLDRAIQIINGLCSLRNCRRCLWLPIPGFCKKCWSYSYPCGWGSWCSRSECTWVPCSKGTYCKTYYDVVCLAYNAGCSAIRKAAYAALAAAEAALRAADSALTFATNTFRSAIVHLMDQQLLSRAAKLAAAGVQFAFDRVKSVTNTFNFAIQKIWFDQPLTSVASGIIPAGIELTVFGTRQTISHPVNMKNLRDTAEKLARKYFPKVFSSLSSIVG